MGKRKKSGRKAPTKRKQDPLPTTFTCLFCNHEKAVTVKLDKKGGIGTAMCKVCGQSFQTTVNYLAAAVDVYADWVDACEAVHEANATESTQREPPAYRGTMRQTKAQPVDSYGAKENEDGFVVDDEMDAEAEYEDE